MTSMCTAKKERAQESLVSSPSLDHRGSWIVFHVAYSLVYTSYAAGVVRRELACDCFFSGITTFQRTATLTSTFFSLLGIVIVATHGNTASGLTPIRTTSANTLEESAKLLSLAGHTGHIPIRHCSHRCSRCP
ncbi:hypothetical protein EDB85DRAFT_11507 [Lactarius pseudohatsudake]|nr:hypothetical protein EDB85DRAFT_11507 [Lactarius pseudohatsudake]